MMKRIAKSPARRAIVTWATALVLVTVYLNWHITRTINAHYFPSEFPPLGGFAAILLDYPERICVLILLAPMLLTIRWLMTGRSG